NRPRPRPRQLEPRAEQQLSTLSRRWSAAMRFPRLRVPRSAGWRTIKYNKLKRLLRSRGVYVNSSIVSKYGTAAAIWCAARRRSVPDRQETLVPLFADLLRRFAVEFRKHPGDGVSGCDNHRFAVAMRAACRFLDNRINDAELVEVLGRDLHVGRGFFLFVAVAPDNRGRAFGRDHRVDGVFEHKDAVCRRDRDRAARAALTDDDGNHWNAELQAAFGRTRDRFGLPTLFRPDARIGARRIDESDDRQIESVSKLHQPHGFAIAFGAGHSKDVLDALLGIGALLVAEHDDRSIAKFSDAADDRLVLGEIAITCERREILYEAADEFERMWTFRVARDERLLPWRQLVVGVNEGGLRLLFEPRDLVGDLWSFAIVLHRLELGNFVLELQNWFLEIEISTQGGRGVHGTGAFLIVNLGVRR